jgi:folate-dependent phosphoribosylglycinamide formyltransferase PurN
LPDRNARIGVVVFTGGPLLEPAAGEFMVRLDEHPEINLLAVFHESAGGTPRAVIQDLWRRRGPLALPVLMLQGLRAAGRFLPQPGREIRLRRRIGALSSRIHRVTDTHAPDILERIRRLKPQLGLIYGGPILKPALFEIPTLGTLGIHHGKLPEYRGKKTTFWAMFNDESSAGVTIQRVNAGLDTGEVVEAGSVPIGRRPLRVVWNRLEALGLDLYLQAILEVNRGTATCRKPAGKKGPLYRDPGISDVLVFWWRYLVRLIRGPKPDAAR